MAYCLGARFFPETCCLRRMGNIFLLLFFIHVFFVHFILFSMTINRIQHLSSLYEHKTACIMVDRVARYIPTSVAARWFSREDRLLRFQRCYLADRCAPESQT